MKFIKHIACAVAALASFACQEVDKTCALPADMVVAPVLDEHSDIIVDAENLASEVTFTWSAVDYGYPAAVTYALYCVYGDADPYPIGESHTTSYTLTKEALNNALVNDKGLAVPAEKTSTVLFYIESSISTREDDAYTKRSEPITLAVTTVKSTSAPWIRRPLWLRGNFTGWNDQDGPVLWENGENSDIYEGLVYLGNAAGTPNHNEDNLCHFKFCPNNPGWNGNLGGDPNGMTTEGDPEHITAEDGLYWISVTLVPDHSTGNVKLTKIDCIGVIGSAVGGWDPENDVLMSLAGLPEQGASDYADQYYTAMRGQTWTAVCDDCKGGEFKFRLNHAWTQNWGAGSLEHLAFNAGNFNTALTGKVCFSIDFHGDIAKLAEDSTNPSPISATVEKVE